MHHSPAVGFEIIAAGSTPAWNKYVEGHPKGTVFHTSEMIDVYRVAQQYEAFARAAVNARGQIVALLVATRIETISGTASSLASRSIFHAEPLCNNDEEGIEALAMLIRLHDRRMRSCTLFSEIRNTSAPGPERVALEQCGYQYKEYLNYVVDLTQDTDALWENCSKACRRHINRCYRRNVVIRDVTTADGIRQLYELIRSSYQRARIPLADISLFHAALERLPPGTVQIRIAYHHETPVAGGIVLLFNGRMYAWYGGTIRPRSITPFDALTWDEIQWGSRHQLRLYDFGGAGWPDQDYGPRRFKAKFGGHLVNYGRYLKVYSGWKLAMARTGYRVLRNIVSSMSVK